MTEILWAMTKDRDEVAARLVRHEDTPPRWEIRLSFNGTRFHSRIAATLEEAATEAEYWQRDYLERGWLPSPDETGTAH